MIIRLHLDPSRLDLAVTAAIAEHDDPGVLAETSSMKGVSMALLNRALGGRICDNLYGIMKTFCTITIVVDLHVNVDI